MSGKYAFAKGLKELRFHHCQSSEGSNAVRYDHPISWSPTNGLPRLDTGAWEAGIKIHELTLM